MPGPSLSNAAKAFGEAVVQPTAQTAKDMGQVALESLSGTAATPPTQPQQAQTPTEAKPNPETAQQDQIKKKNILNFFDKLASEEKALKQQRQQELEQKNKEEEAESEDKQIKQFRVKEETQKKVNRQVHDAQRVEIKKGSS